MSGRDRQLPRGDREDLDERTLIPPQEKREGFIAYLDRLASDPAIVPPSGASIRKADKAMARTAQGRCPGCGVAVSDESDSVWCPKCRGEEA